MSNQNRSLEASSSVSVRTAASADIEFIVSVEKECFAEHRQSTKKSISNSIQSPTQQVFIAEIENCEGNKQFAGAAVAFLYKRTLRIYSIAVRPQYRRMGVGETLMQALIHCTVNLGYKKMTLEADASNRDLVNWYRKFGFEISRYLEDYYTIDESAYRMIRKSLNTGDFSDQIIIVVDDKKHDTLKACFYSALRVMSVLQCCAVINSQSWWADHSFMISRLSAYKRCYSVDNLLMLKRFLQKVP